MSINSLKVKLLLTAHEMAVLERDVAVMNAKPSEAPALVAEGEAWNLTDSIHNALTLGIIALREQHMKAAYGDIPALAASNAMCPTHHQPLWLCGCAEPSKEPV